MVLDRDRPSPHRDRGNGPPGFGRANLAVRTAQMPVPRAGPVGGADLARAADFGMHERRAKVTREGDAGVVRRADVTWPRGALSRRSGGRCASSTAPAAAGPVIDLAGVGAGYRRRLAHRAHPRAVKAAARRRAHRRQARASPADRARPAGRHAGACRRARSHAGRHRGRPRQGHLHRPRAAARC